MVYPICDTHTHTHTHLEGNLLYLGRPCASQCDENEHHVIPQDIYHLGWTQQVGWKMEYVFGA